MWREMAAGSSGSGAFWTATRPSTILTMLLVIHNKGPGDGLFRNKPTYLLGETFPEVSPYRPVETALPLIHPLYLVIMYSRGRSLHPFDRVHGKWFPISLVVSAHISYPL